jgi:hypothetical protein
MRSKSSMLQGTPAAWAIASRCSTALVEPPVAMITRTAFSRLLRVKMSRGLIWCLIACTRAVADSATESAFSASGLAMVEDAGSDRPNASIALDMVLAVYMPPQAP